MTPPPPPNSVDVCQAGANKHLKNLVSLLQGICQFFTIHIVYSGTQMFQMQGVSHGGCLGGLVEDLVPVEIH